MAGSKQRESDKNLLFSKLLPALNDNPFSNTFDSDNLEDGSLKNLPDGDIGSDDLSMDSLSALHSRLFARNITAYDASTFSTINIMESLVLKHLDQAISRFNVCRCDRCKCDIAAYALNILPARYVVATPSKVKQEEEEIPQKLVTDAIVTAVIKIRSHPRH